MLAAGDQQPSSGLPYPETGGVYPVPAHAVDQLPGAGYNRLRLSTLLFSLPSPFICGSAGSRGTVRRAWRGRRGEASDSAKTVRRESGPRVKSRRSKPQNIHRLHPTTSPTCGRPFPPRSPRRYIHIAYDMVGTESDDPGTSHAPTQCTAIRLYILSLLHQSVLPTIFSGPLRPLP